MEHVTNLHRNQSKREQGVPGYPAHQRHQVHHVAQRLLPIGDHPEEMVTFTPCSLNPDDC
jgi:hypothetical protein